MPWKTGVGSCTLRINGAWVSSPARRHEHKGATSSSGCSKQKPLRPIPELLAENKRLTRLVNTVLPENGNDVVRRWVRRWVAPPMKRAPVTAFGDFICRVRGCTRGLSLKYFDGTAEAPGGFFTPSWPDTVAIRSDLDGVELLHAIAHESGHAERYARSGHVGSESDVDREAWELVWLFCKQD